jgi:hypothetical protein
MMMRKLASVSCDSRSESVESHDRELHQTGESHDDRKMSVERHEQRVSNKTLTSEVVRARRGDVGHDDDDDGDGGDVDNPEEFESQAVLEDLGATPASQHSPQSLLSFYQSRPELYHLNPMKTPPCNVWSRAA